MKNDKRGAMTDLFVWIIIGFITVLFLGIWMYGHTTLTNTLTSIVTPPGSATNISGAAQDTFGQVEAANPILRTLAFVLMFSLAIAILVSNFLVKAHPVFFILYILIVIVAVVFSVYISNAYEDILANGTIGETLSTFTGANFILANLPIWVTVMGVIGGILLFIGVQVDRGQGGSII